MGTLYTDMNISTASSLLAELYRPVQEELSESDRIFDHELISQFPFVNRWCETVRSYRGKRLRPAMLLLSARACGNITETHKTLAAVVEMVHLATLVHDDMIDQAGERRKQPTIARVEGNVAAVLLGDYLISHAFHLCSGIGDTHAARRIGAITNAVCEGEMLQNVRRGSMELTEDEYLEIIRRKTGALTSVSCELGAHYAGADASLIQALSRFGEAAGMAFQIVDDVLDIVGQPCEVGKTLGLDLASGRLTLPMIHALRTSHDGLAALLRGSLGSASSSNPARIRAALETQGSFDYAMTIARDCVANAIGHLRLLPPSDAAQSLTAMAEFILHRSF